MKKFKASAIQILRLNQPVEIANCPDPEFSDLKCLKIGDNYYLPSVEWTKYSEPEPGEEAGSFDPVSGMEWEVLVHAVEDENLGVEPL
jgi:hypothetical protein